MKENNLKNEKIQFKFRQIPRIFQLFKFEE